MAAVGTIPGAATPPLPAPGEFRWGKMVSHSRLMGRMFRLLADLANSDAPVLLIGESGTGKTELALALHSASKRKRLALVQLHGLSADQSKAELIGEGSPMKPGGAIREARSGTLVLLNVGSLGAEAQDLVSACLSGRAIIGRQIRSVLDSRFITTTRQDLIRAVRLGHFRGDLFHKIASALVKVPPLRERREDLIPLAQGFLEAVAARLAAPATSLTQDAQEFILGYSWPGNLRQLQSVISLAAERARGQPITHHALAEFMGIIEDAPDIRLPIGVSLADAERAVIRETLGAQGGNRQRTADVLKISRRTLYEKLRTYRSHEIPSDEF